MRPIHRKIITGFTASVYFAVNSLFLHAAESNMWTDRRRAAASAEPTQTASLPASVDPLQVLKGLPDLRPASLSPDVMEHLSADVSADVLRRHTALLGALPPAHVSVRRLSSPKKDGGRTVVFLQDVHQNDEAQRNLGEAVKSLSTADAAGRSPVSLVALEAAFGPMNFAPYRQPQDRDEVRAAADHLLGEHQISGPVHTAYTFDGDLPSFAGVDDPSGYEANIEAYRRSTSSRTNARFQAASRRRRLEARKKQVFNDQLLAFDRSVSAYHADHLSFGGYVEALFTEGVPTRFAHAARFMDALRMEKSLDFDRVEKERARLIEELVRRLPRKDMDALLRLSVAYRMGAVSHTGYYKDLARLCRANGVNLSAFPGMDAYLRYVILSGGIDADKLLKELHAAEAEGYTRLAATTEEKDLVAQSRRLTLVAKLIEFSLTPDEWAEYGAAPTLLSSPLVGEGRVRGGLDLSSFESFYKEADARNHAMTDNLLKAMDARSAQSAAFVAGGFHTTGMTRLLNDRGVTVIEAAPKLTKVDGSPSAYLSVFTQEKTPLEQLFKGNKLFVGQRANKAGESGATASIVALEKKSPEEAEATFSRLANGARMTSIKIDEDRSDAVVETPAGKAKVSLRRTEKGLRFTQAHAVGLFAALAVMTLTPVSQGVSFLATLTAVSHLLVPSLLYVSGALLAIVTIAVFRRPLADFVRRSTAAKIASSLLFLLAINGCAGSVQPASSVDQSSEQQDFFIDAVYLLERLRNPDENERKKLVERAVVSRWLVGQERDSYPLMDFFDSTTEGDLSRRRDVMLILHRLEQLKFTSISARAALLADLPETDSYEKTVLLKSFHDNKVPDATDTIVRVLKTVERGNGNVHMAAVEALGEVGGFGAVEALLKVLEKPGRYTRGYNPIWVRMSTRDGFENPRQLTPAEAEKDLRLAAVRALGKMEMDFEKITPVLEKIAGDPHQDRDLKAEAAAAFRKVLRTREVQRYSYNITVDDVARGHALMMYRYRQSSEAQAHIDEFMLALRDAAHTAMGRPMPLDKEQTPLMTLRTPADKRARVIESLHAKDPAKEVLERFNTLVDKILPMSKEALDALEDLRDAPSFTPMGRRVSHSGGGLLGFLGMVGLALLSDPTQGSNALASWRTLAQWLSFTPAEWFTMAGFFSVVVGLFMGAREMWGREETEEGLGRWLAVTTAGVVLGGSLVVATLFRPDGEGVVGLSSSGSMPWYVAGTFALILFAAYAWTKIQGKETSEDVKGNWAFLAFLAVIGATNLPLHAPDLRSNKPNVVVSRQPEAVEDEADEVSASSESVLEDARLNPEKFLDSLSKFSSNPRSAVAGVDWIMNHDPLLLKEWVTRAVWEQARIEKEMEEDAEANRERRYGLVHRHTHPTDAHYLAAIVARSGHRNAGTVLARLGYLRGGASTRGWPIDWVEVERELRWNPATPRTAALDEGYADAAQRDPRAFLNSLSEYSEPRFAVAGLEWIMDAQPTLLNEWVTQAVWDQARIEKEMKEDEEANRKRQSGLVHRHTHPTDAYYLAAVAAKSAHPGANKLLARLGYPRGQESSGRAWPMSWPESEREVERYGLQNPSAVHMGGPAGALGLALAHGLGMNPFEGLSLSASTAPQGGLGWFIVGALLLYAAFKLAPFWRGFVGKVMDAVGRLFRRTVSARSGALLLAGVLAVSSAEGRAVAGQEELLALAPAVSSLGLNAFLSEKGGDGASAALLDHLNHPTYRFNPVFRRDLAEALRDKGVALDAPAAAAAVSRAAEREVSTAKAVLAAANGTFLLTQVLRSEKDLPGLMALLAKHKNSSGHVQVLARDRGLESLVKAEIAKLENVSLDFRTSTDIPSDNSRQPMPESVVARQAGPWLKALQKDRGLRPGDAPFYVSYPADMDLLEGDVPELFRQWNAERIRSFLEKAFKVEYQRLNDLGWMARLIAQMA